ncbi:MAG: YihY/virulence factor BrkB family protein [Eubacterium sp.]|nr:YihY/virulence factor BrkB family protein [Eubacterium sp.]
MKGMFLNGLRLMDKCKKDNIGAYAAQTAFFIMMSFVPLIMFFITLIQYTPISEAMLLQYVHQYLPKYLEPFVITILDEVYSESVGILSTTAVIAIWSASKGLHYLSNGLDEVHEVQEKRNWFVLRVRAVFYTFVFLVAIVIFLVLLVFGRSLEELLVYYMPVVGGIVSRVLDFRILIITPIMILTAIMAFHSLPDRKALVNHKINFHNQLPGAVLCTVVWYIFSFGVSIYVGYFNGFSMYGSLTTIVLTMFWIYFGMYILLFCAEVNKFYYREIENRWEKMRKKKQKQKK